MLDPSLRSDLVELITSHLNTMAVTHIGRLVLGDYDSHVLAGRDRHITVSVRANAELLVSRSEATGRTGELIRLLVDLDDRPLLGKRVRIPEMEGFLARLARHGYCYEPGKGVIAVTEDAALLPNWGSLRPGKVYEITVLCVDIVDNSGLVRRHGIRRVEPLYHRLRTELGARLRAYDGRVWSWAGDGGVCAFTFQDHRERAVLCAIELQCGMPVFNLRLPAPLEGPIALRAGIDTGRVKFARETGQIVSDTVNFAAHLEKKVAQPGTVVISADLQRALSPRLRCAFRNGGSLEGRAYAITHRRLDEPIDGAEPTRDR